MCVNGLYDFVEVDEVDGVEGKLNNGYLYIIITDNHLEYYKLFE